MPTARQVAAGDPVTKAVASKRHFAVLQEVARACELSDVQHVIEPSAILEDPNGTGAKIELDLLMRDAAGMLIGVDATIGTWDKENARKCMVRGKMEGYGTVGARQVAQRQLQEVTNYTRREVQNKRMNAAAAEAIVKKAGGRVKDAYRPGYREAAARAGVEVHVLPITLSGGWHKEACQFLAKVQHKGDKAAQVGDDSEQARFEHRAQTWATALHGKWLRQSVGVAVAKHTWRGVRAVVGGCERRGGGGVGMVGEGGLTQSRRREEWSEVVRSPARSGAREMQGEVWNGGGGGTRGNTTSTGDINGDNAATEQQQDRNSAAAEPGVRSVRGARGVDINGDNAVTEQQQDRNGTAAEPGMGSVRRAGRATGRGTGGTQTGGVQGVGAARQKRRGRQRQGGSNAKQSRGVWVDPATQQVGNIAELDPGAYAFGRL